MVEQPRPATKLAGLGVLALIAVVAVLCGFERENGRDFHWHVVLGEQMLRAHGFVRTEQFSFTNAGGPLFVSAWLADLLLALAFRAGGYVSCQLLHGLCMAATFVLLALILLRRGVPPLGCAAIVGVALCAALPRAYLRPEMFALLSFALLLWLLDQHERSRRPALLVAVLTLVIVWANLHGSVIIGLVAVSCYAAEWLVRAGGDRRAVLQACLLPVLAFAAACVNPEGVRLPLAFRVVSPNFSAYITEWQPFHRVLLTPPIAVLIAATVAVTLAALRRASPWRTALFAILVVLSLRYHRFLSQLVIASVPMLGLHLVALLDRPALRAWAGRAIAASVGSFACIFALASLFLTRGLTHRIGIGIDESVYPKRACEFVRDAPFEGRMLNSYDFGDYLLFCMPGQKVFIDQRAWSAYPDALYGRYIDAMRTRDGVRRLAEDYQIGWALVSAGDPLAEQMALDPDVWRLVYLDDVALIYVRGEHDPAHPTFRFLNPLNLAAIMASPVAARPILHEERDRQTARCPGCRQTKLLCAAVALRDGDNVEFEHILGEVSEKDRDRLDFVLLRGQHALATRRFALAAALFNELREYGSNPVAAGVLEAEALLAHGDAAGARRVMDEISRLPGGEIAAKQLRARMQHGRLP